MIVLKARQWGNSRTMSAVYKRMRDDPAYFMEKMGIPPPIDDSKLQLMEIIARAKLPIRILKARRK